MSRRKSQVLLIVIGVGLIAGSALLRRAVQQPEEPETETAAANQGAAAHATKPPSRNWDRESAPLSDDGGGAAGSSALTSGVAGRVAAGAKPRVRTVGPDAALGSGTPGERQPPSGEQLTPEAAATKRPDGLSLSVTFDNNSLNGTDETAPIIANNIEFDPNGGSLRLPPAGALAYPDAGGIDTDQGTVALWARPEWDQADLSHGKALVELTTGTYENRLGLSLAFNYVTFLLANSAGVEYGVGFGTPFASGEWHHIAATWGDELLSLYLDGNLKDQKPYAGTTVIPPGTPLYVGSSKGGPRAGILSIRGFNVFQRQLAGSEINALLDQTAPSG